MTNENREPRITGESMTEAKLAAGVSDVAVDVSASAGVGVPGMAADTLTTVAAATVSAEVPVDTPTGATTEVWSRAQVRRHWLIQLVVLLISFSLITGVAMVANLRRRERDTGIVAPAHTILGVDSGTTGTTGTTGAAGTSGTSGGTASRSGGSVAERAGATPSSSDWTVRPLAIVHRGDDSAPENSLHAIANAGARGADYSEIDVRLDADKVPVVFHDRKTGRLSADHVDVPVSDLTTDELQRMTMRQHDEDFHIPTLVQAIETAQHVNDHTGLLLHLKTDDRHAPALTDAVMSRIEDARFADRTMLMSTSDRAISLIHKRHPDWSVGKCVSPVPGTPVDWPKDASFVVMRGDRINLAVLARARRDNIPVFAGVSDDYRKGNTTLSLGADGILGGNARKVVRTVDRHMIRVSDEGLKRLRGFTSGN
ncbi:hypothetical protein CSQ85_08145 [Bifidobacterium rousetti]|uniref:glycerophosphodiester phosphodiesterase family protein n=1 Tax=Bifidobacterium rousetti TaxID=2045439 RepID=UPI00123BA8B1|nr:glycerophosphodiester phosphodiesterase family protein [Bifidobacterium rousetti]KAA8818470.1 hypothetical protein CSQ85_08145 [Bifidobacterium rousetti]